MPAYASAAPAYGSTAPEYASAAPSFAADNPYGGAQVQATPQAAQYEPFQGPSYTTTPAWQPSNSASSAPVSNRTGWISLGAGAAGLAIVVVSSMLGQHVYLLYFPVLVGIGYGIRSLIQRAAGTSTSLIAPVLGILMGLAAGGLFLSVVFTGSLLGIQPTDAFDPTSNAARFPKNPELSSVFETVRQIERGIQDTYAAGSYPTDVVADASGNVTVDGTTLGTVLPGQTFTYTLVDPRTFTVMITATIPGESVIYDSVKNQLLANCFEDDALCESNLPPA